MRMNKAVETEFEGLLKDFKLYLQTMDRPELIQLYKELLFIRYYLTALSMKPLLEPEQAEEIVNYLQAQIGQPTLAMNGVLAREMVQ